MRSLLPTPRAARGASETETMYRLGAQRDDSQRSQGHVTLTQGEMMSDTPTDPTETDPTETDPSETDPSEPDQSEAEPSKPEPETTDAEPDELTIVPDDENGPEPVVTVDQPEPVTPDDDDTATSGTPGTD